MLASAAVPRAARALELWTLHATGPCAPRVRALISSFLCGGLCGRALGARGPQVEEALVAARKRVAELEALLKIKHEEAARDQVRVRESWMLYLD